MPPTSPTAHLRYARRPDPAALLLGARHPLTRALAVASAARRQAAATGVLLAACAGASVGGARWAGTVAGAAGLAVGVLLTVAAGAGWAARQRALDLIVAGGEAVPIPAVARQRRRLLAPRTQRRLAAGYALLAREATEAPPRTLRSARPVYDRRLLRAVAAQLRTVAALLRAEPASAPGVALAERLLTDGLGVMFGGDADAARAELRRVVYLLSAGSPSSRERAERAAAATSPASRSR
jgi:hypothetical protein